MNTRKLTKHIKPVLCIDTVTMHRKSKNKPKGTIQTALAHNKRTYANTVGAYGTIDPARRHLNYSFRDDSTDKILEQWGRMHTTIKPRKNAPDAVEIVFSLPYHYQGDAHAHFSASLSWAIGWFGEVNFLTADVHLDQNHPHMHVLFLPIVHDGELCKWKSPLGGRGWLYLLRSDYILTMSEKHGITLNNKVNKNTLVSTAHELPSAANEPIFDKRERLPKSYPASTVKGNTVQTASNEPYTRERDSDKLAVNWSSELGGFVTSANKPSNQEQARKWVAQALARKFKKQG